jgi:hypothetical protein
MLKNAQLEAKFVEYATELLSVNEYPKHEELEAFQTLRDCKVRRPSHGRDHLLTYSIRATPMRLVGAGR